MSLKDQIRDWPWYAIVIAYVAFLCSLASCARPLKDTRHESVAKAAVEVKATEAKKEEAATSTRQQSTENTTTVYLRPDGKPWKIEGRSAGVLLSIDTSNLKLLNSSLQLQGEAEAKTKGSEIQKAPWSIWRVLGTVAGIALVAGLVGYVVFRVIRWRWPRIVG